MTARCSFPWQLCSTSGDGSGYELWLYQVFFTSSLCHVKRNKDRPGARQLSGILGSGKQNHVEGPAVLCECLEVLKDEHQRKNERKATPPALHLQSVPGHLVSILPTHPPMRMCFIGKKGEVSREGQEAQQ